jgi:restriction system protein
MPIPDFQTIMLPLLECFADSRERTLLEVEDQLAKQFKVSPSERTELLPSGRQATFTNRIGWARTYLGKALLLEQERRSYWKITQRGRDVLKKKPVTINVAFLEQFPEFQTFRSRTQAIADVKPSAPLTAQTPEEGLETNYLLLQQQLAEEMLERVKKSTPTFFERLVVDLLVKMGYGGSRTDAAEVIGQSGDGGIDGIIKEDRLGLDQIHVQAKRWTEKVVGRPDIQQFSGALDGPGSRKGVFITTSVFSKDALDYAKTLSNKRIVLIDGQRLSELMIEYGLGVNTQRTLEIKRVDSDYFDEE